MNDGTAEESNLLSLYRLKEEELNITDSNIPESPSYKVHVHPQSLLSLDHKETTEEKSEAKRFLSKQRQL